jgi:hypothetical protein
LTLAIYDYSGNMEFYNKILDTIGMTLTYIFTGEALLKIFAMGFVLHKKAYLRDWWNAMDFMIVISGYKLIYYLIWI